MDYAKAAIGQFDGRNLEADPVLVQAEVDNNIRRDTGLDRRIEWLSSVSDDIANPLIADAMPPRRGTDLDVQAT